MVFELMSYWVEQVVDDTLNDDGEQIAITLNYLINYDTKTKEVVFDFESDIDFFCTKQPVYTILDASQYPELKKEAVIFLLKNIRPILKKDTLK